MNGFAKLISKVLFPPWHYVKNFGMLSSREWCFLGFVHLPFAFFYSFSFLLQVLTISRNLNHLHSRIISSVLWFWWPDFSFVNICEKSHAEYYLCRFLLHLLGPSQSILSFSSKFKSSVLLGDNNLISWESGTRDSKTNQITKSSDC